MFLPLISLNLINFNFGKENLLRCLYYLLFQDLVFLSDGRIKVSTGGEELLAARLDPEFQVHTVKKFPGKPRYKSMR